MLYLLKEIDIKKQILFTSILILNRIPLDALNITIPSKHPALSKTRKRCI